MNQESIDCTKVSTLDKVVSRFYISYIQLVSRTSSVKIEGVTNENIINNAIVGFWHGDSFAMNLLLQKINNNNREINVVVTKDKRGNYIESIIKKFGAGALRMPDGIKMKGFLRELKDKSKESNSTLCIALDGPLGPYKDPKKVAFMLSNEAMKPCILVESSFSRKITLNKRWDKYVIPLPFSKIQFELKSLGVTQREELKNFNEYKKRIFL